MLHCLTLPPFSFDCRSCAENLTIFISSQSYKIVVARCEFCQKKLQFLFLVQDVLVSPGASRSQYFGPEQAEIRSYGQLTTNQMTDIRHSQYWCGGEGRLALSYVHPFTIPCSRHQIDRAFIQGWLFKVSSIDGICKCISYKCLTVLTPLVTTSTLHSVMWRDCHQCDQSAWVTTTAPLWADMAGCLLHVIPVAISYSWSRYQDYLEMLKLSRMWFFPIICVLNTESSLLCMCN